MPPGGNTFKGVLAAAVHRQYFAASFQPSFERFPQRAQIRCVDRAPLNSPQEQHAGCKEDNVRHPYPQSRGNSVLFCQRHTDQGKGVIGKDEQNREDETSGLASFFRPQAQRDAHQSQHHTSG